MDILQKLDSFVNTGSAKHGEDEYLSDLFESIYNFLDEVDIDNLNEEQFEKFQEILEMTDGDIDSLQEVKKEKVVRGGKKTRKVKCKQGYKAVSGKCVRMSSSEKRTRSKAAKRGARKAKSKKTATSRKRQRSIKRRR